MKEGYSRSFNGMKRVIRRTIKLDKFSSID